MLIKIFLYVCFSAFGLLFLKLGVGHDFVFSVGKHILVVQVNDKLIFGAVLYIISFVLSLLIMKEVNLSLFYPMSAGLMQVAVCLLSVYILHEKIDVIQLIGIGVILAGVVMINIK